MNKIIYVLELIWLFLAIFCLGMGIYATITVGFDKSYVFFILSVVAILMYLLRRNRRLKEKTNPSNQ